MHSQRRQRETMSSCQLAALKARLERERDDRPDDDVVPGIVVALLIARKENGR